MGNEIPVHAGRYTDLAEIGLSATGRIYRAFDPFTGRWVAVRILRIGAGHDSEDQRQRFLEDVRGASQLLHQNIVSPFDHGEEQGLPFAVMALLEGENLRQRMDRVDSLGLIEKLRIMIAVAAAMDHAHRQGVAHVALKPSRIHLLPDGMTVVRMFPVRDPPQDLDPAGRLQYTAPEGLRGNSDQISDIYSYGAIFYELIVKRPAYHAETPSALSAKIENENPPPIRSLVSDCPPALEELICRAMDRDRARRYRGFHELLEQAERILRDLQKSSVPDLSNEAPDRNNYVARLLQQARVALSSRDFRYAVEQLEHASSLDPGNPEVALMLLHARARMAEIAARLERARRLVENGNFAEAQQILESVPGNHEMEVLGAEIRKYQVEAQGRRASQEIRKKARELCDSGQFQDALTVIESALAEFPDEMELAQLRDYLRSRSVSRARQTKPFDDDVQFTVYRPMVVPPEQWKTLLAFAHRSSRPPGAPDTEPDPVEEVQRQAEQILGKEIAGYRSLTQDSTQAIPREGELTFVPEMKGVTFNPSRQSFLWEDRVPPASFLFKASLALNRQTVRGHILVFLGSIVVAQIPFNIRVDSATAPAPGKEEWKAAEGEFYRKIFASYSHQDAAVVEEFERYADAFGDDYIRDVKKLRTGDTWDSQLLKFIEGAHVFQLFWSSNSMHSEFVRREYSHALALGRGRFVLPVYWEEPLPEAQELDLPPAELRSLHFHRISLSAAPRTVPSKEPRSPVEPVPPPAIPEGPSEFTRFFQSGITPSSDGNPISSEKPPPGLQPAPQAGEFTQMFGGPNQPDLGMDSAPAAQPPSGSSATGAFSAGTPGPGEFTRMISPSPQAAPGQNPVPPSEQTPVQPRANSNLPLYIAGTALVMAIVLAIVFFALRHG